MNATTKNRFSPTLESLEDRLVPTVTFHGGHVMPHVEVQGIYLGNDWNYGSLRSQAVQFEKYLKYIVKSPYMDMLKSMGYGVGRGTFNGGIIDNSNLNKSSYLTDSDIRGEIQYLVNHRYVKTPDTNRLFVVYVEPNVAIRQSNGDTSIANFLGYHSSFNGADAKGHRTVLHYAVIAYPGGSIGNASVPGESAFAGMTTVSSHELAEAVTDPDIGTGKLGWYDTQKDGEVGDINRYNLKLGSFYVQSIINKKDQAIMPHGAKVVSFNTYEATDGVKPGHNNELEVEQGNVSNHHKQPAKNAGIKHTFKLGAATTAVDEAFAEWA